MFTYPTSTSGELFVDGRAARNRGEAHRTGRGTRWASRSRGSFGTTLIWLDLSSALFAVLRDFLSVRAGLTQFVYPDAHAILSQGGLLLFFSLALRLSLTPPSEGLDEHAAAQSFRRWINLIYACWLTHALIRQGLPHSTSERPTHPKPGSRVGRGFPLTAHMPQPVRPTSRVHARARSLKITSLANDPSLHHRHLPPRSRPHDADKLPRYAL